MVPLYYEQHRKVKNKNKNPNFMGQEMSSDYKCISYAQTRLTGSTWTIHSFVYYTDIDIIYTLSLVLFWLLEMEDWA